MSIYDDIISELTTEECWEVLRGQEFGRLAYLLGDEVNIAPVNYTVVGETLLFMTAEGSKLLGVVMHPEVVFEVDRHDDDFAHSVIVRGRARQLPESEEHRVEGSGLRTWIDTLKYNVVEIAPTRITGRRFRLTSG